MKDEAIWQAGRQLYPCPFHRDILFNSVSLCVESDISPMAGPAAHYRASSLSKCNYETLGTFLPLCMGFYSAGNGSDHHHQFGFSRGGRHASLCFWQPARSHQSDFHSARRRSAMGPEWPAACPNLESNNEKPGHGSKSGVVPRCKYPVQPSELQ